MSIRVKRSVSVLLIGMLLFYSVSWGQRHVAEANAAVVVPVATFAAGGSAVAAGVLFVAGVIGTIYLAQVVMDNGGTVDINWDGVKGLVDQVGAYAGMVVSGITDVSQDMTVQVPGYVMNTLARSGVVVHPGSPPVPAITGVEGVSVPPGWQWAWENGEWWGDSDFQKVGTWTDDYGVPWDFEVDDDIAGQPGKVAYTWPNHDYSIQNWPSRVSVEGFSSTWYVIRNSGYIDPVRVDFVPTVWEIDKSGSVSVMYEYWVEGITYNGNPKTGLGPSIDMSNPGDLVQTVIQGSAQRLVGYADQGTVVAEYPSQVAPDVLPLPDSVEIPIPGGWVRQLPDGTVEVDVPTIDLPEPVPYEIPDWSHLEPGGEPPEEPPKREVKPPVPPWWWPAPEYPPQGPVPDIPRTPVEVPAPEPTEFPTPGPTPEPGELPTPMPMPEPEPGTNPSPWPYPNPGPGTNPLPPPNPKKVPIPWPTPTPIPWPGPNPQPTPPPGEQDDPWNHPIPVPTPEPNPSPEPQQQPIPNPDIATETTFQRVERELRDIFDPTIPIDWEPMRRVGVELTERFPFSLPWDVWRAIDAIQSEGKLPELKGQFYDPTQQIPIPWEIKWPDWIGRFQTIVRWALFFIFNVGLIYVVVKLFKGAS